jgi:hypothetical protein
MPLARGCWTCRPKGARLNPPLLLHRTRLSHGSTFYPNPEISNLEVLVLLENAAATARLLEQSLGMALGEMKGALPLPWFFSSNVFHLTPMARSLRGDQALGSLWATSPEREP